MIQPPLARGAKSTGSLGPASQTSSMRPFTTRCASPRSQTTVSRRRRISLSCNRGPHRDNVAMCVTPWGKHSKRSDTLDMSEGAANLGLEAATRLEALMAFEVFNKRMAPLAKAPSITIQKRGIFSVNKAAHKLIGEPDSVELLFDRDNGLIALRPSMEPHAYAFRPQSSRADTGQVVLSATAFTQYYDIDTTVSRRYEPFAQDGMLCIDLRGRSAEVIGNRTKRGPGPDPGQPDT